MHKLCASLSLFVIFQCCSIRAELLCDYPLQSNLQGIFSNEPFPACPGNQEVAASFRIAATNVSLRHISWHGFWWGTPSRSAQVAQQITRFRLRLYPDTNSSPAALAIFDQTLDAKIQSTGHTMNLPGASSYDGNLIFRYDADVSAPGSLPSGQYWLVITATHPTPDQWLWCRSSKPDANLMTRTPAKRNTWAKSTNREQTAFSIETMVASPK